MKESHTELNQGIQVEWQHIEGVQKNLLYKGWCLKFQVWKFIVIHMGCIAVLF
jgi:hypothetical protein